MRIGRESEPCSGRLHRGGCSPISIKPGKYAEMPRNGEVEGKLKINRIPLVRTAVVELLSAPSPACVWVRLENHITQDLVITDRSELVQITSELEEFDYCMAPISVEEYARCRVLKKGERLYNVMFIDHGVTAWVNPKCLAEMPRKTFPFQPWQAICISVCGMETIHDGHSVSAVDKQWTEEECDRFRQVLGMFDRLKTKTLFGSMYRNCYREPVKVEIYGLRADDLRPGFNANGVSISSLMTMKLGGKMAPKRIHDATHIPIHLTMEEAEPKDASSIPEFQREWGVALSDDVIGLSSPGGPPSMEEWEEWSPDTAEIPMMDQEYIQQFADASGEILLNVEGAHTKSPYEWFARPIKRVNCAFDDKQLSHMESVCEDASVQAQAQLGDDSLSILTADRELKELAQTLDTFYSNVNNRCVLEKEKVVEWLREDKKVYAIFGVMDERALYTGEWQRVQVLSCEDQCLIRYLDSGGRDYAIPSQLYKIHPLYSATFEVSSQQWKSVAKPTTEQCKKEAVGCQLIMTPRTDGNKNLIGVSSYGACAAKPNDSSLGCEMEDLFIEQAGVQTGNCICTQDNCNLALALKWMRTTVLCLLFVAVSNCLPLIRFHNNGQVQVPHYVQKRDTSQTMNAAPVARVRRSNADLDYVFQLKDDAALEEYQNGAMTADQFRDQLGENRQSYERAVNERVNRDKLRDYFAWGNNPNQDNQHNQQNHFNRNNQNNQ